MVVLVQISSELFEYGRMTMNARAGTCFVLDELKVWVGQAKSIKEPPQIAGLHLNIKDFGGLFWCRNFVCCK
jgi:hypothetical protein